MPRAVTAVVVAIAFTVVGCGEDRPTLSTWCGLVAGGAVVPLDSPDAPEQWMHLEESAPADLREDVERLRVAADQVAVLEVDDLVSASLLVLTPRVLDAHGRVVDAIRSRCRIDASTLTVIDQR